MRIWFLDLGSIVIDHAQLMWNIGGGTPVRIPCYAVLIEHEQGLFLFDTGFDRDHVERVLPFELPEQTPDQTVPRQLELCGFRPEEVAAVINSHLHFDHCGGNRHLPEARVLVHAREIAQARNFEPFEHFGYSDRTWDHDRARLVPLTGDVEVAPGIRLYETPGHTVGHYSLLLEPRREGRPMLFPADVVFTAEALGKGVQSGFHYDPVAGVRSIRRIRELAEEYGADIYFSHDMDAWGTYRRAPDHYLL